MRCHQCGHENPERNRFCGMCGNSLVAGEPQPVGKEAGYEDALAALPWEEQTEEAPPPEHPAPHRVETRKQAEPVAAAPAEKAPRNGKWWVDENESTVGGPSFLGLSSTDTGGGGGYSYLFQDEPERSHTARWVLLALLVVLGALVYVKWQPIRDYVLTTAISHSWIKPAQAQQAQQGQQASNQQGEVPPSSAPTTTLATTDPQAPPTIVTEKENAGQDAGKQQAAAGTPEQPGAAGQPEKKQDTPATAKESASSAADKTAKPEEEKAAATAKNEKSDKTSAQGRSAKSSPQEKEQAASEEAEEAPRETARREPVVNEGAELVSRGEKYLYGRGVTRNCDQAVTYFQAAAAKQNPQAFSHLGALYATGECVPMDRAVAYAWFRRAYAREPSNHYFEQNLTMLWREMTPGERQRATRSR